MTELFGPSGVRQQKGLQVETALDDGQTSRGSSDLLQEFLCTVTQTKTAWSAGGADDRTDLKPPWAWAALGG